MRQERWEDYLSISFQMLALYQFLLVVICVCHWFACWWGYVGEAAEHLASDQTPYTTNLTIERCAARELTLHG